MSEEDRPDDMFCGPSDVDFFRDLLMDFGNDLSGKVARRRCLNEHDATLGEQGTMFPGGMTPYLIWLEARSSFVLGNFAATILLCQALVENVLAGHLHMLSGIPHQDVESLPSRVRFSMTLDRCQSLGILAAEQVEELRRLVDLRNPLSHFRSLDEPGHSLRRSVDADQTEEEVLSEDAHFAIAAVMRVLALPAFRVGP